MLVPGCLALPATALAISPLPRNFIFLKDLNFSFFLSSAVLALCFYAHFFSSCGLLCCSVWDFPGGIGDKNPPVHAGDTGLIFGPGRFHN